MPYPNEHSARIKSPRKFVRFRRQNDRFGPGIDVIWGIAKDGHSEVQAIRYDSKIWTAKQAEKNARESWKILKFEPAVKMRKNPVMPSAGDVIEVFDTEKRKHMFRVLKISDYGFRIQSRDSDPYWVSHDELGCYQWRLVR